jgi:hypothetical protein
MLVFDPATMNVTRFTLARVLVNGGYYEMARAEILSQIRREFGETIKQIIESWQQRLNTGAN